MDGFARGLMLAAGVTGDTLDLSQKLGGDRPTVLRVIVLLMAVLTSLNLMSNNIGAEGAKALADALASGRSVLNSLSLAENDIGPTGATAIAEALKLGMAVLKKLVLSSNSIKDEGAIAISESLKTNKTLEELNLFNNGIGPAGGKAIGEALQLGIAVLKKLDLRFNDLGEAEQTVRDAAKRCSGLELEL